MSRSTLRLLQLQLVFHRISNCFQFEPTFRDIEAHAYYQANHAAQKAIGRNMKNPTFAVVFLDPFAAHEIANRCFGIVIGFTKSKKIGIVQKQFCCFLQFIKIQFFTIINRIRRIGQKWIFFKNDMIFIAPLSGIVAGMHIFRDRKNFMDSNVFRQKSVDSIIECRRKFARKIKMSDKSTRMYTRVGTPAARNFDFRS